jgi:hypothetical protein
MTNNISKYTRKRNIKNIIDEIITKTFDVIFYPLRFAYSKYNGSELQSKKIVRKEYKKLQNSIYKALFYDDNVYITDFWISQEHTDSNIISTDQDAYIIQCRTKKTAKEIFNEIEDILRADDDLLVEYVNLRGVFKYGSYKEDGRVLKINIIEK